MKLLFLSDVSLENPSSGAEQVLNNQAAGLIRKGFNVFAITRQNGSSKSVQYRNVNRIKEACYNAIPKNAFLFLYSILRKPKILFETFIKQGSFRAFVCHQPFTCISLLLNGKLKNSPLIYVFHSPSHEEYLLLGKTGARFWKLPLAYIRKVVEGYCLKRAQKIIVLSQYMKKKAMEIHKIHEEVIVINAGGVDLDRFKPIENRNCIKAEVGFSVEKIHLLTVRNLEPRMGLDSLLRGVKLLKDVNVQVQLVIVGEGPEKEKLQKLIKEFGIINDVTLVGFIPANKLPKYYGAADFFILPTSNLEGFGLVTPESMACGTPVLGTPIGGTKEILGNFDPQFLFSDTTPEAIAYGIQKAVDIYLKDEDNYNQLRTRCRQFVIQNYSWQRHIDQLKSIIDELIETEQLKN
jgi:glycosyltransferase involved in cell wall biosynthesis